MSLERLIACRIEPLAILPLERLIHPDGRPVEQGIAPARIAEPHKPRLNKESPARLAADLATFLIGVMPLRPLRECINGYRPVLGIKDKPGTHGSINSAGEAKIDELD